MNALNILTLVLSIAASIVSIVANWRVSRVENKLIQIENKLTQIATQGDNSPVLTAGGDINVTNITQSFTNNTPLGFKFSPPPTTPPSDISP
jgi:signal transduction histidine kinase